MITVALIQSAVAPQFTFSEKEPTMFDNWKLKDFAPGEGVKSDVFSEAFDDSQWIDVPVPGDIHRALVDAERLDDPFYDQNELKAAWIEDREWWYRLRFDGPTAPLETGERLLLVFHGLDTFVTLWLNGEELGRHANMFTEAVFDVTDKLRIGEPNVLALCFDRPLDHVGDEESFHPWGRNNERVFMRKAQFGYGWDWGPRLPTIGIWRPVELRRQRVAAIRGVHFYTVELALDNVSALVAVKVDVDRFATDKLLAAHIRLTAPTASQPAIEQTLTISGDSATAYLQIDHPAIWWTHDLGTPALYSLDVRLEQNGVELDKWQSQVGIRTMTLDQSPDPEEPGTRFFRFVLNGVTIFAKGANWIPADSFVGSIPAERYEMLLTAARDANMNMLRLWGGGIYEHDSFYELCDRLGLLIWHDFMFACAPYPDHDPAFTAEVEAEARYQVSRLRNHPAMALWCGNNENQWLHEMRYWQQPEYHAPGVLYYNHTLPQAVAEVDGHTPYWPGSPFGGSDYNGIEDGDRHNWQVWHGGQPRRFGEEPQTDQSPEGVSFVHYADDLGRFISEFGMHASPIQETLRRVIPADQRYHHSPSMDHHNKDNPKNKGDNLMMTVTGLPTTLEDYIDFSMIAQAEGLKFGIEHFRRRSPHCSGTIFWQLNDCWPVLSWSVLDYYGFGKAGYYYARRAYAPVLASFKSHNVDGVELWITNDTLADIHDTVTVRQATYAGQIVREEKFPIDILAQSSQRVYHWTSDQMAGGPDQYLVVRSTLDTFPANRHFFAPIKDLQRSVAQPEVSIEQTNEHELHVHFRASSYAYFVHLTPTAERTQFSDNYFDLEPGETRTIIVTNPIVKLSAESVKIGGR
jgi:beta-mannosidase